jgi:hypothetical protein
VIFGRDLLAEDAKVERLAHMTDLVLAALRPAATDTLDPGLPALIGFNQRVKIQP